MNDVYRQFNPNQSPLIALSITVLDRTALDINCTPDKRTIFLEHLPTLSEQIRTLLNKLFESTSNVTFGSKKRTQESIESSETEKPPTKQMCIERFTKTTVCFIELRRVAESLG